MIDPTRTAWLLRKLARIAPSERRELHRVARMLDKADYADELARWAWQDVRTAAEAARDAYRCPGAARVRDAAEWIGSAVVWATAAAVCAATEDMR